VHHVRQPDREQQVGGEEQQTAEADAPAQPGARTAIVVSATAYRLTGSASPPSPRQSTRTATA
jgi:hypothetical protein